MPIADWDIVVVVHNSWIELAENWASLDEQLRSRVIVVDNGSRFIPADIEEQGFSAVVRQENLGLSKGNNSGALRGSSRYLLFCNPDIAMNAEDLPRLEEHLDNIGGLVSPRLHGSENEPQESVRGWPTLIRQVRNRLGKSSANYLWPIAPGTDGPVPWLLGAVVAVSRHDFQNIGGWPEEYFLYFEDTELCMRAWDRDLPVWILGSLSWFHRWARSSRHTLDWAGRQHLRSAIRFYTARPQFLLFSPKRPALSGAAGLDL